MGKVVHFWGKCVRKTLSLSLCRHWTFLITRIEIIRRVCKGWRVLDLLTLISSGLTEFFQPPDLSDGLWRLGIAKKQRTSHPRSSPLREQSANEKERESSSRAAKFSLPAVPKSGGIKDTESEEWHWERILPTGESKIGEPHSNPFNGLHSIINIPFYCHSSKLVLLGTP